jgi:integrase
MSQENVEMRNAADAATPPRVTRSEPRTWTPTELRTFLGSVTDDRLYAAWLLLASSGMRRGELLGLRWQDVDLDAARVSVTRSLVSVRNQLTFSEPKTRRGWRSIALDTGTVAELRVHRVRQAQERLALGVGSQARDALVFTDPLGEPVKPDSFSQFFERRVKQLELPRIRLHDVRHTHATLALEAGVHPKVVSERLGHASTAFTLDTYSHAVPAMEEQAAELIATLVRG